MKSFIGFAKLIFDDIRWMSLSDTTWFGNFQTVVGDESDSGLVITPNEYLYLVNPTINDNGISVDAFIAR